MNAYNLTFLSVCGIFIVAGIFNRVRQLKKSHGFIRIVGDITHFSYNLIGETVYVYIDAKYVFKGVEHYSFGMNTNSINARGFEVGSKVFLLVDPYNPRECRVETAEIGDRFLHYFFRRFIRSE